MPEYVVKPGDTLGKIAQRVLGSASRWRELGYKGDPNRLPVGTKLTWGDQQPAQQPAPAPAPAAPPANPTPWITAEEKQRISEKFGPGMAAYTSDEEIGKILVEAMRDEWPPNKLQARLRSTARYQRTQQSQREWEIRKVEEPETAAGMLRQQLNKTRDFAGRLGVQLSEDQLRSISEDTLSMGWDEGQVADVIVGFFKSDPANPEPVGTIGLDMAGIKRLGAQYLIDVSDQEALDFSLRIAKGEMQADALEVVMRTRAKARFPQVAQQIDDGATPADIFAEHRNAIAREMEIAPEQVDLIRDTRWAAVLDYVDQKGNRRPMSIPEAMEFTRSQDEWFDTRKAKSKAASIERMLLENLGKLPGAA